MASQIFKRNKNIKMKILGIETSCDETAASIIEGTLSEKNKGLKIISHTVATSAQMHAKTGGVIPENAAREQIKSIIPVIKESLISSDIDAIAVTIGPGLIGSLLVGVETAKTLSYLWKKPIIPVNHLIGHIYANFLIPKNESFTLPEFPLLALVVSGGHTDLVFMENHGKIKYIGGTRDDAAGEAFDKTARLLGLPYPGGPNLSKKAQEFIEKNPEKKLNLFPRPMINEENFDWSFSGLKTAVRKEIEKNKNLDEKEIQKFSAEVQEAIVESLVEKSLKAIEKFKPKSFLLAGGVAANKRLRETLQAKIPTESRDSGKVPRTKLHIPEIDFCTDNAAYIAAAAFYNYTPIDWQKINANPELTITD
jgi:N6-L-threonylcarbamoyladenine synthase